MIQKIYNAFLECNQKITTDTRNISSRCIFFALKGPNFNGNRFASEALAKGASYVVVDEENDCEKNKTFVVNNVLQTLQDLASFHRKKFKIPFIGITGTNGKTTTKELIGKVLSSKYNLLITTGNLNNHIGVPLTLLKLNKENEIAVIEMGASKKGDIKELCEIALPTHGIITNIGKAHLKGFGSAQIIKETKLELYENIFRRNGEIIVNKDDKELLSQIPEYIKKHTYGIKDADACGHIINQKPTIDIQINFNNSKYQNISTNLLGSYNLMNILASATVGKIFGLDTMNILKSIENYEPSNNRSQLIETGKNTIIADCYNANPTSTLASIRSLLETNNKNKIAILGDMLELGKYSEKEHQSIVDFTEKNKINCFLVGGEFYTTKTNHKKFHTTKELITYLKQIEFKKHLFLLKGSRGIKLEEIINCNIL
tara:strand:+ start:2397 stop:3686 length:1290 start_codon:yes stop_codon:yes gene_type:complete